MEVQWVVDAGGKLVGVLVFRELLYAEKHQPISDIMLKDPFALSPEQPITEAMRAEARLRYHLPPDAIVFGMLTRLDPEKGVDIVVEAFRLLQETRPARAAYLVIAGKGPEGPALSGLAAKYGLADRIHFIGFVAKPIDVLPLFEAIVLSSRFEGLPLALLEGMAAGAVPIVARVGGIPEVINEPELGWVVPPEDVAAFAHAMGEVLALGRDGIAQRRLRLLERVRTAFDATAQYDALLQVAGLTNGILRDHTTQRVSPPILTSPRNV
jgi:glycosyltransferase involved in cell wall biosynthesis